MPRKQFKATVTKEYTLDYNPESRQFKAALKGYKESIDRDATEQQMLAQIAYHIDRFGADGMIEGIGYLKVGKTLRGAPYSGIELLDDEPESDIEIISNDFV